MDMSGLINSSQFCETDDEAGLPLILKQPYFIIKDTLKNTDFQRKCEGVVAICTICSTKIKGSKKVTSNFLQHYRNQHQKQYHEFKELKSDKKTNKDLNKQMKFDQKVLKFITSSFSPMSIVENPDFMALFEDSNITVKSRKHMQDLLDKNNKQMELNIKNILEQTSYVCCTADVWSGKRKSFFGYTVHWIQPNLIRNSAILACRRFKSPHTFLNIAAFIEKINSQYDLDNKKIVATTTDNGTNFVKAFKTFGVKAYRDDDDSEDEFEFRGFSSNELNIFNENAHENRFQLSKHYRCGSHTLNLLSTSDYIKLLQEDDVLYQRHNSVISKCENIWSKTKRPKSYERIYEIISTTLKTPTVTRWNSLFDSIQHLLQFKDKINEITNAFDMEEFSNEDFNYLEEYIKLMQPIAEALDFFQSEHNIYFGYLLPTLLTLKLKLKKNCNNQLLGNITSGLISCLEKRFEAIFVLDRTSYAVVVAAITCPLVRFLKCSKLIEVWQETSPFINEIYLENLFIWYLPKDNLVLNTKQTRKISNLATAHNFFNIYESDDEVYEPEVGNDDSIRKQLRDYTLENGTSLEDLERYHIIKKMFFKTNTPLPSSGPVERLFSLAGMVNQQRRQRLTDDNFEKFVLAKANSQYF